MNRQWKKVAVVVFWTLVIVLAAFVFVQSILIPNWTKRGGRAVSNIQSLDVILDQPKPLQIQIIQFDTVNIGKVETKSENTKSQSSKQNIPSQTVVIDSERGSYESRISAYDL